MIPSTQDDGVEVVLQNCWKQFYNIDSDKHNLTEIVIDCCGYSKMLCWKRTYLLLFLFSPLNFFLIIVLKMLMSMQASSAAMKYFLQICIELVSKVSVVVRQTLLIIGMSLTTFITSDVCGMSDWEFYRLNLNKSWRFSRLTLQD